ncbi:S-adenosyl-L-methionine-dependent methyltransferase [Mycena alexandri]|uniref:S-adenosyl-L-methionine-dependent methyltransferase n=1 Tax=Mycena alexandri TaxID=1745969 RepID=A0AAD6TB95_9AGAR|nr:S-adenosyl-L-methionine-dependent methyltransferase [Mycena alexandri]
MSVHAYSQASFAKGTNELYNNARAQYRPEALLHLRRAIKSSEPLNIIEIGSGTGLFTRALLVHEEWTAVRSLKAVEPSEGMRETFSKYTTDPRVAVFEGTFDRTGVDSGWADLLVIAHAFHWCLDYEGAAAEFARVLKHNGVLALIWNHQDRDAAQWLAQVRERVERDEKGSPHWRTGLWRQLFGVPSYAKSFAPAEEQTFRYNTPGTLDGIISRGLSSSRIVTLTDAGKEIFVKDVEEIMQRGEGKVWIEEEKGTFEYPHRTDLVICKRV